MFEAKHTPGPWIVRRSHIRGQPPEHDTFDVLAPNEDAGKKGVVYAGDYLSVATELDSQHDAKVIALAPELLDFAAFIQAQAECILQNNWGMDTLRNTFADHMEKAQSLLDRANR
jgi:hypothetical protein